MTTYHVEIEHTVYVVVEVEADSKEKAIELAHEVTSPQEYGTSVEFDVEEPAMLVEAYYGGSCSGGQVTECEEEGGDE
jgi:hypothetical protein